MNAYFRPEGFIIEDGIGLPMSPADPLHAWQKAFEADKVTTLFHLGFLNKEKWLKSKREITKIIDWMIVKDYLDIDYDGRLPLIIFSARGWERYKPIYVEELFLKILLLDEDQTEDIINQLKQTNRQVIEMLLLRIGENGNNQFIEFMINWEAAEVKKVRTLINHAISKLK